jgi:hypothetical protein
MRLSSDIWVYALIRRVQLAGSFATLLRKGDARGGAVLVKTVDRKTGQSKLWAEAAGRGGDTIWMRPIGGATEADVDAYIDRAARIDPDVWVVEVEDANGRRFLTERVEGD